MGQWRGPTARPALADPILPGSLCWHHAPFPAPLPACLYPLLLSKPGFPSQCQACPAQWPKASLQLTGACWEGSALPRPGQPQLSPSSAPCGVCDVSMAATFARSGPLSPARDSARGCPRLVGPCVATALGEGACPGQRGCRALMDSMTCSPSTSELPCAVLQGLSGDTPGVTHGAGFPQPALKHQLHHLTGGVLGKSEDAILSVCWEGQREGHGAAEQSPEEAPG